MITCKKATELMIKDSEKKTNLKEKVSLRLHTMLCKACRLFETQNKTIDQALFTKSALEETTTLSTSKKEKLEALINKTLNN